MFSVCTQLGARFDKLKRDNFIIGVETFNSTKKKMGICFRVSLHCTEPFALLGA